ncbi:MAG: metallophosphoesterase [Planctomycetes bacterium]|nr:metallophosphoesterase [Planctomycetota bacterium]
MDRTPWIFVSAFALAALVGPGPCGASPSPYPTVEVVAGRSAVSFDGDDRLLATFSAPGEITGDSDFTVAVWAYNPRIDAEECMVQWARRGTLARAAQLNFGRAPGWGAVTHWSEPDMGFDGGVPSAGAWHHIAVTYEGGADGIERVYVDGEVNATERKTLRLWTGGSVRLGGSEAGHGFSGSLAEVRIHDAALSEDEIRFLAGGGGSAPGPALVLLTADGLAPGPLRSWTNRGALGGGFGEIFPSRPGPEDGAMTEALSVTLTWTPGDQAASHDIHFGEDSAELAFQGNRPATKNRFGPVPLQLGKRYLWRLDPRDAAGALAWGRGRVWSFVANTGQARSPKPADGKLAKPDLAVLAWTPGSFAVSQEVRFGPSIESIESGSAPHVAKLDFDARRFPIPALPLRPGQVYYWRVDTINRDLPPSRGSVWSFRVADPLRYGDVTFFIVSDSHYGATAEENADRRAAIDRWNGLPGTEYPAPLGGGIVQTPRGILVLGDLIDDGATSEAADQWAQWVADFGVGGEGRVDFPVYEGLGNHDLGPGDLVLNAIRERNRRRPGLKMLSSDGLHYSLDWDHVHVVNLNLYPGDVKDPATPYGPIHDPKHALSFLRKDLAENVGRSGRPVILCHHYDLQGTNWWSEAERDAYFEAIQPYNIICIAHGHTGTDIYKWRGIDVVNTGNLMASCFVFRVTIEGLVVVQMRGDGTWGLALRKAIAAPATPGTERTRRSPDRRP